MPDCPSGPPACLPACCPPLQLFVSMLRGLGITTKAVCSFQPKQLKVGMRVGG